MLSIRHVVVCWMFHFDFLGVCAWGKGTTTTATTLVNQEQPFFCVCGVVFADCCVGVLCSRASSVGCYMVVDRAPSKKTAS